MKIVPKMGDMNLSREEKQTALAVGRRRYAQLNGKKKRGEFLDGFCAVTGLSRKHAIAALNPRRAPTRPPRRRGAPKKAPMKAVNLLARIWKLAGKPCGKLLRPILGAYLAGLRKHGHIDDDPANEILAMSASTGASATSNPKPAADGAAPTPSANTAAKSV